MKFTITRSVLKTVLQRIRRTVAKTRHMPVLNYVRCAQDPRSGVTLTATDLDRTLRHGFAAEAWEGDSGAFLVSIDDLSRAAQGRGAAALVTLEARGEESVAITTEIGGQPVERLAASCPASDFPPCEMPEAEMSAVDAEAFLGAYRLAAPYVSLDDTRGVLQGIYLESEARKLVATDGRRLTALDIPEIALTENAVLPVVPLLTAKLDIEGEIQIGLAKTQTATMFRLDTRDWTLAAPCIEGTYPNYRQVLPAENPESAAVFDFSRVPAAVLKEALSQFSRDPGAVVALYADSERVVLAGNQPEGGGHRLLIPLADARCATRRWLAVGVNPAYFEEPVLQGFTRIEVENELSPLRFTAEAITGVHVLMPMRCGDMTELRAAITGKPAQAEEEAPQDQEPQPGVQVRAEVTRKEDVESGTEDPRKAFASSLSAVTEVVRAANRAVRDLKAGARDVERYYRGQVKAARASGRSKAVKFRPQRDQGLRKAS